MIHMITFDYKCKVNSRFVFKQIIIALIIQSFVNILGMLFLLLLNMQIRLIRMIVLHSGSKCVTILCVLKAVDTIGNYQRLAFTVSVSQHMHKITNL